MEVPEFSRTSVRDVLNVIFKYKFHIVFFFLATFSVVTVATLLMKPTFEAKAQILVKIGRESIYMPASGGASPVISISREEQLNSEIEILRSQSLAKGVVESLGATTIYPALNKKKKGILAYFISESQENENLGKQALMALQENLEVQGIKKSNVIEVSFKHTDPQMAAAVVDALTDLYLERHVDVHKTPHSYAFFREQSELLKHKLDQSEAKLKALKAQYNVTSLAEQQNILLQRTHDIRMALNQTFNEEVEVKNRIQQLRRQLTALPKTVAQREVIDNHPNIISSLEARLVDLQLEEEELMGKYTEQSRLVQNVRKEINVVEQKLFQHRQKRYGQTHSGTNPTYQHLHEDLLRSQADLNALKAKNESLKQQLTAYKNELDELNTMEVRHNQLEQEVEVDRQNYRLYLTKFEESRISDAMDSEKITSVTLIEPVQTPLEPVSPKVLLNLLMGFILGALGGLSLAFILNYLDDSMDSVEEVEEVLDVPVLISLAADKSK